MKENRSICWLIRFALLAVVLLVPASRVQAQLPDPVFLLPAQPEVGAEFGYAVAEHENTLVAAAWQATESGQTQRGAVYVFARSGDGSTGTWTQIKRLVAGDGGEFDRFGGSAAIYGDTIVVGAPLANIDGVSQRGAVYIFSRNEGGPNNWGQVTRLTGSNTDQFDNFGEAVAIHGNTIVAGAPSVDIGSDRQRGAVFVFTQASGVWTERQRITVTGNQNDSLGTALAFDGVTLVASAPAADITGLGENDGAVHIFGQDAPGGDWLERQRITASDFDPNDNFGSALSLGGDLLAVGARFAEGADGTPSVGKVYLFTRGATPDTWTEVDILSPAGAGEAAYVGHALYTDGHAVLAASRSGLNGAVHIFEAVGNSSTRAWEETGTLAPAKDAGGNDLVGANFGQSMAADRDSLVIGASGYNSARGAGMLYSLDEVLNQAGDPATTEPLTGTVSIHLPAIQRDYTPFQPTGQLVAGQTLNGPDGVRLGATAGSLAKPTDISLTAVAAPALPLPGKLSPRSEYVAIRAGASQLLPGESPLVLALPLDGVLNPAHLALAVLKSTTGILDYGAAKGGNQAQQSWTVLPGLFKQESGQNQLLARLTYLDGAGVVAVVVEDSSLAGFNLPGQVQAGAGPVPIALCAPEYDACNQTDINVVTEELGKLYAEFVEGYKYVQPFLPTLELDLKIDPTTVANIVPFYVAHIYPPASAPLDGDGKPVLGTYDPRDGTLRVYLPHDTKLDDTQRGTVRHEFFHALQFGYNAMRGAYPNDELWLTEGTAESARESGHDWNRSNLQLVKGVDYLLNPTGQDEGVEYQAQDFWVFLGHEHLKGTMAELRPFFANPPTTEQIDQTLRNNTGWGLGEHYWDWARNQTIEKRFKLSDKPNVALGAACQLQTTTLANFTPLLFSYHPIANPRFPAKNKTQSVAPLTSAVVEIQFPESVGTALVYVNHPACDGAPDLDAEISCRLQEQEKVQAKIYVEYEERCEANRASLGFPSELTAARDFPVNPNERYFVLVSNKQLEDDGEFYIAIESIPKP